jgi:hypothetical protein
MIDVDYVNNSISSSYMKILDSSHTPTMIGGTMLGKMHQESNAKTVTHPTIVSDVNYQPWSSNNIVG